MHDGGCSACGARVASHSRTALCRSIMQSWTQIRVVKYCPAFRGGAAGHLSGSDSSGTFVVQDRSSGSADEQKKYDFIGKITKQDNSGVGFGFPANSQAFVEKKFIYAAKKRNPEGNYSSDGVTIVGEKEENFFRDDDANDNYYI